MLTLQLQTYYACDRIAAARALAEMGQEASSAVPALTIALYSDGPSDLRESSAYALGRIGSASRPAVPVLVGTLLVDESWHVRSASARALRSIGDVSAVPALAKALEDESIWVAINAAEAIAFLADLDFPGLGGSGYELAEDGKPKLVHAALQWWNQQGRFKSWIRN